MVVDLLPGLGPVDARLVLVDFAGVGHAADGLRRQLQGALFQRGERAQHQVGAKPRQRVVHVARGHIRTDGYALRHRDRAGIETFFHFHHHHAGFAVAGDDGALDRRGTAPARQQRSVQD